MLLSETGICFEIFNYCIVYFTPKSIFYKVIRMVFVFRKGNEDFKAKCAFLRVELHRTSVHIRAKPQEDHSTTLYCRRRFFTGTLALLYQH